ncbi:hypothetical protein NP493_1613g00099 [Ridgeia piscesae]|uniref:Secreted protein n=1 Tax=Ridgeia piscesae TaxID=27915 RepID=A0AAD9JXK6_RIDPI|nr:hypothetical protein NP493_1613g00099 [Ridgeia piscesae]
MASFIQRAHLFVALSTTFAPSQSITQLCLSAWSVIADLCSTLVEHFHAPPPSETSSCSSSLVQTVLPVSPM